MPHDQNLLKHLWKEEPWTTMYGHNKTPHRILGSNTPKEMFTAKKPKVRHLRIFGYPVYVYVPKDEIQIGPFEKEGHICWLQ
jgi:hypothetical protein